MSKYPDLKSKIVSFFNEDVKIKSTTLIKEEEELESVEKEKRMEQEKPLVYAEMDKIVPKNPRVKAAYINKARQGATMFLLVVEELDKRSGDDDENDKTFYGRCAVVCKHNNKPVYSAVSFIQRSAAPIPPSSFKMVPLRSSLPTWVRAYSDGAVVADK